MTQLPDQKNSYCFKSQFSEQEQQVRFLSDVINNQQADVRILEWAGFVALENKQWLIAENIFSSLLERRNKASDLVGLAKALRKQHRMEEAEECYLVGFRVHYRALFFIIYSV